MALVKICGLSEEKTLQAAIDAGADLIGFVHFEKSPRHVSLARAAELKKLIPNAVKSVLVVVNPDDGLMAEITRVVNPDFIQLHGKETPARIAEIRKQFPTQKLIKAISVSSGDDIATAHAYASYVDILLFDAKPPKGATLTGGNGISFDWQLLANRSFAKPWLLSGGLNAENVSEAIRITGAKAVDVSSGVESTPGVKDAALIRAFIEAAKS